MSLIHLKLATTVSLLMLGSVAMALPFASYDPRSMAMGGAGVAVSDAAIAPMFNPALLSTTRYSDDFSLVLPTVGVRIADPKNFYKSVDQFQQGKYIDNLQTSVSNLQNALTTASTTLSSANFTAVSNAVVDTSNKIGSLSAQLQTLSDKPVAIDGGIATVIGIPNKKFGIAFYANRSVAMGGVFTYKDAPLLNGLATMGNCLATTSADAATAAAALEAALAAVPQDPVLIAAALAAANAAANAVTACGTPTFASGNVQSSLNFRGAMLTEMGISVSREYYINKQRIAVGITPKIIQAQIYEVPINANSSNMNASTGDDYMARYSMPNFDLGVAQNYRNGWRSGLVIKNVIPYFLYFKNAPTPGATPVETGNMLRLMPQTRVGISHTNRWSIVALDADLYRNDPAGLENYTQYVSLGGELNAWDWAQLRAGFRADLVNNKRNIVSLGLGFSPFGVHADIAVAGNRHEAGASFQLGFRF